jgi:hypothetical protein
MSTIKLLVLTTDNANPADDQNIRAVRPGYESPIDNTKAGIVNFGAKPVGGASTGATANYATIGGGSENSASGIGATVPGGTGNTASGQDSLAQGYGAAAPRTGQISDSAFGQGAQSGRVTYGALAVPPATPTELLDYNGAAFALENNKTYAIKVRLVVAGATVAAQSGIIEHTLLVYVSGTGVVTIMYDNLDIYFSSLATAALAITATNAPGTLHLTFTNTLIAASTNVAATIDWSEVHH